MSVIERFSYGEYTVHLANPGHTCRVKNSEKVSKFERLTVSRPMAKIFDPGGNAVECAPLDWPDVQSGDWAENTRRRIDAGVRAAVRVGQVRLVCDDGSVPDAGWMRDTPDNRAALFKKSKRMFHRSKTNTWMQFAN
ncbi:hypothetical protein [Pelagimonas varians]|uniref:Uncharacterized protein n=1 Tax=Pelagimonas varians TaxID=696760 RepID=A0A238KF45_9RHOB|nr:hypothetical protein [Pelagimonas varians]PYG32408.1 hypothetical protein C8N36_103157 [Pelagimonas varians]SMX41420.1 hypothetical protein PEV8663_02273 [Pelagimonas varians]